MFWQSAVSITCRVWAVMAKFFVITCCRNINWISLMIHYAWEQCWHYLKYVHVRIPNFTVLCYISLRHSFLGYLSGFLSRPSSIIFFIFFCHVLGLPATEHHWITHLFYNFIFILETTLHWCNSYNFLCRDIWLKDRDVYPWQLNWPLSCCPSWYFSIWNYCFHGNKMLASKHT